MAVNRILPFSCIDGPGNRMVIFLQGCSFRCGYCHNPETINRCIGCGRCLDVCPNGALALRGSAVEWDETRCTACDACIRACPRCSSPKARTLAVEDVLARIVRSRAFIDGITVSGGECTLQMPFLEELFGAVKKLGLTGYVDTNGSVDLSDHPGFVTLADGFMLDVKAVDEAEHLKLTGSDNRTVLKNMDLLLGLNKLYEVRTVIAPGMDHEQTVRWVAHRIQGRCRYRLIAYRPHGVSPEGLLAFGAVPPEKEYMEALAEKARQWGATQVTTV